MTTTPLLPVSLTRPAPPVATEPEATKAELDCLLQLALRRNGCTVAIGRGRSPAAARAAAEFSSRWEAAGRTVAGTVTWPEEAASWLRQATRFALAEPDLWIMTGPPAGWFTGRAS